MKYTRPKNGATVTIFAPYDCKNACPFCINKKDYADDSNFDIDRVIGSMIIMNGFTPKCDFVITGGEPLADLDLFFRLVECVDVLNKKFGGEHKLFVNTTLPIKHEDIEKINAWAHVITGFNISRHLEKYVKECPDEWISELKIPVRINCVLYTTKNIERANDLFDRFKDFENVTGFQFRDNYIGVNKDNLYVLNTFCRLVEVLGPECELHKETFRWNATWDNVKGKPVSFHRTMCFSKIIDEENGTVFIGDVIIDPRGVIKDDWNGHGEDLDWIEYVKAEEI